MTSILSFPLLKLRLVLTTVLSLSFWMPAYAQEKALTPKPDVEKPSVEMIGDWAVVCAAKGTSAAGECYVSHQSRFSETNQVVMEINIGARAVADGSHELRGQLGLLDSILLRPGAALIFENQVRREFQYEFCERGRCIAFFDVDQELLDNLKAEIKSQVVFVARNGKQQNIPISLNGFSAAIEASGL